jgi:hypothetical protein
VRTLAVIPLVLALAACGGSSSSSGWDEVAKRESPGKQLGAIAATVQAPRALQVKVEASPPVKSQISYSIDCANGRHPATGVLPGTTPFTAEIPLPSATADSCTLNLTASKSRSADMTLTVLSRAAD